MNRLNVLNRLGLTNQGGGGGVPAILDDGNTVAWYDYLENVTKDGSDLVSNWGDKSGLSHDLIQLTGTNQPIVNANGILFDGVDNFMKTAAFTLVQPEFIYMVVKQITWSLNRLFDGNSTGGGSILQAGVSPQIMLNAGSSVAANANLVLNTYGIVRALFNGASSSLQINETTKTTGNAGANNMGGFTLATLGGASVQFGNIEAKEIIIRKVADTSTNEAAIYSYLSSKYSIT